MKQHLFPLLILSVVTISQHAMADTTTPTPPPTNTTPQPATKPGQATIRIKLTPVINKGNRPKAPSSIYITCTYSSDGYLWFDDVQAAALNVTVTGLTSGFMADYITTPDQPIYIGTIAEDLEVTCHTSENQTFQGIIALSDL